MTIDDKIREEKSQYSINRESGKISALFSRKIDNCEYLTGEKFLPSNQRQIIKQARFAYSLFRKAFEKQTKKRVEDQGMKQFEALKALKPEEALKASKPEENQELESIQGLFLKNMRTNEIKN